MISNFLEIQCELTTYNSVILVCYWYWRNINTFLPSVNMATFFPFYSICTLLYWSTDQYRNSVVPLHSLVTAPWEEYQLDDNASSFSPSDDNASSSPFLPLMQTWTYRTCDQPLFRALHINVIWIKMFLYFFQAILFYIPRWLWKNWEAGKIQALIMDLDLGIISEVEKRQKKKLLLDYLYSNLKNHNFWAYRYFFCELLSLINVIGKSTDVYCYTVFLDFLITLSNQFQKIFQFIIFTHP